MRIPFKIVSRSYSQKAKSALRFQSHWQKMQDIIEPTDSEPHILQAAALQPLYAEQRFSIVDVGANSGDWALAFQRRFPNAVVHAVEADPETYNLLEQSTVHYPNIHCHHCACSSTAGTIRFYSDCRSSVFSSILDLPDAQGQTHPIDVTANTLDGLVATHSPSCLRLIKIDTEGHDLAVLQGAKRVLASTDMRYVILEFGLNSSCKRQVHLNQLCQFMEKYRFFMSEVSGFGICNGNLYGNALFVKYRE
jgi:FkbM family methyltransferase